MCNDEQPRSRQLGAETRIVDGDHDGLACSCRRDEQTAMMTLVTLEGGLFEKSLVKWLEANRDRAQGDRSRRLGRWPRRESETRRVVRLELRLML